MNPKLKRMRARNKSGTITYIVQTAPETHNNGISKQRKENE